jgi:hypothetical protein
MSEPDNAGNEPENQPEPAAPEENELGPDFDNDFPTYANEANKELNRKVRALRHVGSREEGTVEQSEVGEGRARGAGESTH